MIDFVTIYCYNLIMGKKEYVLYTGEKFTVEWYFTIEGKSQPFDYFNRLDIPTANEIVVFGKTYWRFWENFR